MASISSSTRTTARLRTSESSPNAKGRAGGGGLADVPVHGWPNAAAHAQELSKHAGPMRCVCVRVCVGGGSYFRSALLINRYKAPASP